MIENACVGDCAAADGGSAGAAEGDTFVTFTVGGQRFGVPVHRVQDILVPERIAPVPLAPDAVRGAINLRGRIVTVVDVRARLGLPPLGTGTTAGMGVTVEHRSEHYTLLVDGIGDIIELARSAHEEKPATLDPAWREMAGPVFCLEESLLVVLDVDRLLDIG